MSVALAKLIGGGAQLDCHLTSLVTSAACQSQASWTCFRIAQDFPRKCSKREEEVAHLLMFWAGNWHCFDLSVKGVERHVQPSLSSMLDA